MPKLRIHELAKQLNITSNDVIAKLKEHGIDNKKNISALDEIEVRLVMSFYRPNGDPRSSSESSVPVVDGRVISTQSASQPVHAEEGRRPERVKLEAGGELEPRPEGERLPRPEGEHRPRPEGERTPRPEGERIPRPEGERIPRSEGEHRPRPEGERRLRPEGERISRPDGEHRPRPDGERTSRPEGERILRPEGERRPRLEGERRPRPEGERIPRPEGERRPRPEGERRPRPEGERRLRPEGERRTRPEGEHRPRPEGERRLRPEGERRPRPEGERKLRPEGERRPRPEGERPPRPEGGRIPRPEGERPPHAEGERPPRPENGDRPRLEREHSARAEAEHIARPETDMAAERRARQEGDRPQTDRTLSMDISRGDRPQTDRPPRTDFNRGDRPPRAEGDRPQRSDFNRGDRPPRADFNQGDRPQTDRPPRTDFNRGDRPQRSDFNRGDRPARADFNRGDRPPRTDFNRGDRPPRAEGDRPPRTDFNRGDRPQGDRPQGDRPPRTDFNRGDRSPRTDFNRGDRPQGDRPPRAANPARPGFARPGFARPPYAGKPGAAPKPAAAQDRPRIDTTRQRKAGAPGEAQARARGDVKGKGVQDRTGKRVTRIDTLEKSGSKKTAQSKRAQKLAKQNRLVALRAAEDREAAIGMIDTSSDIKTIKLPKSITVKDLAEKLMVPSSDIIKQLMGVGIMANINQEIDYYNAAKIAEGMEILAEHLEEVDLLEQAFMREEDDPEDLRPRPPVVVVMGHVDHGKTSLLDYIRSAQVTATEAGGITQHIGAYTVSVRDKPITFLDTPGHEAFTAMRMRGAQVTDIAILVVAADDGVMPQTIEAINHARAAGIEIIVAINKIDKESANPDRVKQELTEYGLLAEDWGGDTIVAPVSAHTGEGIEHLLEMIILASEMKELRANPNKSARGAVIEARLDKGRGPVATVLVQDGTLNVGDPIIAGYKFGKVRVMLDDKGKRMKSAGPSMPVEIVGLSEVPEAGDAIYVAQNEKQARQLAESIIAKERSDMLRGSHQKITLDDLFNQIQAGNVKDLNIVIKADVQGSVEAVKNSLERLSNNEVRIRTLHGGVGAVTESDVMLASASSAIIIGFNVRVEPAAKNVAAENGVDVRLYRVIYNAIEDVSAAMKGMLDPELKEVSLGHAEIRQLFRASGVGTIGGAYVTDGKISRNAKIRIYRDGSLIHEGSFGALKRFKDDVREVSAGYECGMHIDKFNDIKEGDIVEAYTIEEVQR